MTAQSRNDYIIDRFNTVTIESWSYSRLTQPERLRLEEALFCFPFYGNTKKQLVEEYEARYNAFLLGLGYTPSGWRDPSEAENRFYQERIRPLRRGEIAISAV